MKGDLNMFTLLCLYHYETKKITQESCREKVKEKKPHKGFGLVHSSYFSLFSSCVTK